MAMGELVMKDPFHHYRCPVPRRTCGVLALLGRVALSGPLFCGLLYFVNGFVLSLVLVVFVVDYLWPYRVKSGSRF